MIRTQALDELLENNNWRIDEADIRHDIDIFIWAAITPPPVAEAREELAQLRAELNEARKVMEEIVIGQGAFSLDQLTHASNVIEHSKEIASDWLSAHPEVTK